MDAWAWASPVGLGVFLAGLGVFFAGLGFLTWGSKSVWHSGKD